jgi:predicted transcriptional regulator of viral defense system
MYQEFRQKFNDFSVISLQEIKKVFPFFDTKNLVNWQRKGYLIKLRNGYYLLSERKLNEFLLYQIANKLYEPSYVSMESALNYYSIIPEGVYKIFSVSTRKTETFTTKVGVFDYRTIKKTLYFGYQLVRTKDVIFKLATREKAVLDFLYLRPDIDDYLKFESLRWNRLELQRIDENVLHEYLALYNSATLYKKLKFLKSYLNA